MASERTDSDQDEDKDPWGLNQLEAEALAALRSIGTAPTPERIDRSPETERLREHLPDPPVIVSTPPHSPLRNKSVLTDRRKDLTNKQRTVLYRIRFATIKITDLLATEAVRLTLHLGWA